MGSGGRVRGQSGLHARTVHDRVRALEWIIVDGTQEVGSGSWGGSSDGSGGGSGGDSGGGSGGGGSGGSSGGSGRARRLDRSSRTVGKGEPAMEGAGFDAGLEHQCRLQADRLIDTCTERQRRESVPPAGRLARARCGAPRGACASRMAGAGQPKPCRAPRHHDFGGHDPARATALALGDRLA